MGVSPMREPSPQAGSCSGSWTASRERPTAGPHPREEASEPYRGDQTRVGETSRSTPCPPPVSSTGRRYYVIYNPIEPLPQGRPVIGAGAQVALTLQSGKWRGCTGFGNLEDAVNHAASEHNCEHIQIIWSTKWLRED